MGLTLWSPAFAEGGRIPDRHTCTGIDTSPPLMWSGAPPETQGFALVCSDPDAPRGTWYHWAVHDLSATTTGLEEGAACRPLPGKARQAVNDFRCAGYGGPCPPKGHGEHRYRFHLLALSTAALALPGTAHCRDVERAARAAMLAETTLTGRYSR